MIWHLQNPQFVVLSHTFMSDTIPYVKFINRTSKSTQTSFLIDPLIKLRYQFDIVCTIQTADKVSWTESIFFKDTTRNLINITRHLLSCRVYIERDISISRAMQLYLMYILNHTYCFMWNDEEEQFFFRLFTASLCSTWFCN